MVGVVPSQILVNLEIVMFSGKRTLESDACAPNPYPAKDLID